MNEIYNAWAIKNGRPAFNELPSIDQLIFYELFESLHSGGYDKGHDKGYEDGYLDGYKNRPDKNE